MPATEPRPIGFKPPWPYRALTYRILIGVVVVALVAGLDAWWIGRRPAQAEAGEVVHLNAAVAETFPEPDLPVTARVSVATPVAPVEVTLGEPVDELASGLRAADAVDYPDPDPDAQGYLAPRGESFVPIRWREGGEVFATEPPVEDRSEERADDLPPPTLSVVVDDEVVYGPVDLAAADERDAIAVAVPDAADVEVQVTFDGATQAVDARTGDLDAGVAEAYYVLDERDESPYGTCGFQGGPAPGFRYQGGCTLRQARLAPWRPGAGWVTEPGQVWAGVSYRWEFSNALTPGEYRSGYFPDAGRLGAPRLADGTAPDVLTERVRTDRSGVVEYAGWLLDEVPERLVVEATGGATYTPIVDGDDRPRVDVDLTFRLSVPAVG